MAAGETAKAQNALAAQNREREQKTAYAPGEGGAAGREGGGEEFLSGWLISPFYHGMLISP